LGAWGLINLAVGANPSMVTLPHIYNFGHPVGAGRLQLVMCVEISAFGGGFPLGL